MDWTLLASSGRTKFEVSVLFTTRSPGINCSLVVGFAGLHLAERVLQDDGHVCPDLDLAD